MQKGEKMGKARKITLYTAAIILSIAIILAPVGIILGIAFGAPSQYTKTFYGALDEKYERLSSIDEEKIVVVGGSSVAFGLDSALLEEYTGMPVVNFGLYADLGTKLMLDLSRDQIKRGDIVILAPELDEQTLSMYFNWDSTLKAMDDDMSMLGEFDYSVDEWLFSIGGFWELSSAKLGYIVDGNMPTPADIYSAENFNEYGDIDNKKFPRKNNIMKNYYDPKETSLVDFDSSIVEDEFISYLNEYIKDCKAKGAKVAFTWCPVNDLAVVDEEKIPSFERYFKKNLECDVIGTLSDYVIDSHYFYDTNFHLNDAGVKMRTAILANDILFQYMPESTVMVDLTPPPMPDYQYNLTYDGEWDENAKYFLFEQQKNGAYRIVGLSEEGKKQTELTVPIAYKTDEELNMFVVTVLNTDIFAGSACVKLNIPKESYISALYGSFGGATNLVAVNIYIEDSMAISPPDSVAAANPDFKFHTPKDAGYATNYNWGLNDKFQAYIVEDL